MADDTPRDDTPDRPQGPTDPHGPGGLDAPAPPGGPQRSDAPSGGQTPGEPAQDPGPGTQRVTRDEGGDAEEPTPDRWTQSEAAHDLQEENAETHLDQPSQ